MVALLEGALGCWSLWDLHLEDTEIAKINPCLLPSRFSRVQLCVTPWTAAYQASLSMGFSRQEHWSGLPFPSPVHESETPCLALH